MEGYTGEGVGTLLIGGGEGEGEGVGEGVGIFLSGRQGKKRGIGSLLIGDKGGGTDSFLIGGVLSVLRGGGVGNFSTGGEGGGVGEGVGIFLSGREGKKRGMGSLFIGGRGGGIDSFLVGDVLGVCRVGDFSMGEEEEGVEGGEGVGIFLSGRREK